MNQNPADGAQALAAQPERIALTTIELSAVWALWPLIAFMGGLGFVALVAISALVLAPSALRRRGANLILLFWPPFFVFVFVFVDVSAT